MLMPAGMNGWDATFFDDPKSWRKHMAGGLAALLDGMERDGVVLGSGS